MMQESGGSMIAVAGMNARARTRRTRKRFGIGATLTVALGVGVLGFGAGGAGAAFEGSVAKLLVNTHKDVVPIIPNSTEGDFSTGTTAKVAAVNACLVEITDPEGGRNTVGTAHGSVAGAEGQINGVTRPTAELNTATRCSLRMALIAAAAIATPLPGFTGANGATVETVEINIGSPQDTSLRGKTFELEPNINNDGSEITSAPLPPIVGGQVVINGCAMAPTSTAPCVNLEFSNLTGLNALNLAKSLVNGSPGLIAAADHTTINGFAFQDGLGPAIMTAPIPTRQGLVFGRLTVTNSWFGLKVDETGERDKSGSSSFESVDAPRIGIQLSGSGTARGEDTLIQRNVFTDEDKRMVGVLVAGGAHSRIVGNAFGTNEDGLADSKLGVGTGVKLTGLDAANVRQLIRTVNAATGQNLDEDAASTQVLPVATDNTISGNVFLRAADVAIDVGGEPLSTGGTGGVNSATLSGITDTAIESNRIGVDALGTKGGSNNNANAGILVRNGARDTTVGGETPELGNQISFNKGPGLVVEGTTEAAFEDGAGLGTTFINNIGQGNGSPGIIQLGNNRVSGGVQPPVITSASPTSVSGTAAPNSTVHVYQTHSDKQGEIAAPRGEATAGSDGSWTAPVSVAGGSYVTATATIAAGTSELASNVRVPEPPKPVEPKREEEQPLPDVTPPKAKTVAGQSVEDGKPVVLTPKELKTLGGQVADESGVTSVRVALQVLRVKKGKRGRLGHARVARICRFVHLGKGRMIRRPCSRPPYRQAQLHEAQSGDTAWRVPLSKKVRNRLRVGRYRLLIESTDANGLVSVERVPVVIKRR